eukprot:11287749-Heterocapsa_arctica.AAC.1
MAVHTLRSQADCTHRVGAQSQSEITFRYQVKVLTSAVGYGNARKAEDKLSSVSRRSDLLRAGVPAS